MLLIDKYQIITDNIKLFINGLKICCLEKMTNRECINKKELNILIQDIKDDIAKGEYNPAHSWLKKLDFKVSSVRDTNYYEGKKATPEDIALKLPIRRMKLEKEIENSINDNKVIVIKASSGQGKTTLAYQVAFNLSKDYKIYKLNWCKERKELNNITNIIKSRVKLGEKLLIIVDNLDELLEEWNYLAQLLQDEVLDNYKIVITTREDDWYRYSGNLSNIKKLKIINISLKEKEAEEIYKLLKKENKLHSDTLNWRSAWEKVEDKKLLIEYIYLITHGQMLSERIEDQIKKMELSEENIIKKDLLRKICFADICGIKLSLKKLLKSLKKDFDYEKLFKSMEKEFFIKIDKKETTIEGLHPVRSQHIIEKLHQFFLIEDTVLNVIKIVDTVFLSKLFSNLSSFILDKKDFYYEVVEILLKNENISDYLNAFKGLLSGEANQYYKANQLLLDEANKSGGLELVIVETNPFKNFKEFDYELNILKNLNEVIPMPNLMEISEKIPKLNLNETHIYCFSEAIYKKFQDKKADDLTKDILSYSHISYWLFNIDSRFNLAKNISIDNIWSDKEKYTLEVISNIMYTLFCGNKELYLKFIENNLNSILMYLKEKTKSVKIDIIYKNNESEISVKYIPLIDDREKLFNESVKRINIICKTLPIFDYYSSDAIYPKLENITYSNDDKKRIPIRNIFIGFHQEFAVIWSKSIKKNYEFDSIFEWLEFWINIRKYFIEIFQLSNNIIYKILENKQCTTLINEFDNRRIFLIKSLIKITDAPNQEEFFKEKKINKDLSIRYFSNGKNFINQFFTFLKKEEKAHLALINLFEMKKELENLQNFFSNIIIDYNYLQKEHLEICFQEKVNLEKLYMSCSYYKSHNPSNYFKKILIEEWYKKKYQKLIDDSQKALVLCNQNYFINYPKKYYEIGSLKNYPIIVTDLDVTNVDNLINFLISCFPICNFEYDYFTIILGNKNQTIKQIGFSIEIRSLKKIRDVIETNQDISLEGSFLLPINISKDILDCFEKYYEMEEVDSSNYYNCNIIFDFFFSFAKSKKELDNESDCRYWKNLETEFRNNIFNELEKCRDKISSDYFEYLKKLNNDIFLGKYFSNEDYNEEINKLIKKF
ncbi:MAG: hypothetical protein RSB50_08360 [Cetobacterium sp.]